MQSKYRAAILVRHASWNLMIRLPATPTSVTESRCLSAQADQAGKFMFNICTDHRVGVALAHARTLERARVPTLPICEACMQA